MSKLTILSVAYPFCDVSADSVGGAEQMAAAIDRAIVREGHRSIVVARSGSRVAGRLVPIDASERLVDGRAVGRVHAAVARAIDRVLDEERVDVVHMHGVDFDRYLPRPGVPVLVTLHLPPSWYSRPALGPARDDVHFVCVSRSQREALAPWIANADVIENGVALDAFAPRSKKGAYCLVLARICPEKGIHEALDAAMRANVPLVIAGDISPWEPHRRYFETKIAPKIKPPQRWVGPVGFTRKRHLLAGARALLVASRAPETSSLVAMEALASGTPVIAFPSGALPSIVEHGRTGFIVEDAVAMADAIENAGEIDAGACRAEAEARFAIESTTSRYLAAYERLAWPTTASAVRGATASTPLVVEEVRGAAALEALAPEWSSLCRRSPSASPFQTPAWLVAYARAFCAPGSGAEAFALAVRRGEELVGIAPLCTRRTADGVATTLLGEGVSDYLDVVVDPDVAKPCVARIIEALRLRAKVDGHAMVLDNLRECSPLLTYAGPDPREGDITMRDACPVLRLVAGIDPVPAAMRDKLRYYRRRADRAGGVEVVEIVDPSGGGWLDTLFALHGARWAARGERGALDAPEVRAFHALAFAALAAAGAARLYGLTIGGRRAAAMLVLRDRTAAYYYIGGFAPELAPVSPGTLLVAHAIDRARDDLLCELDFLRGREAYKYQFGAVDRFTTSRRVERRAEVPARRDSVATMTQTDASS